MVNGVNPSDEPTPKKEFKVTARELSEKLGGVTIIAKGEHDIIASKDKELICDIEGSHRRCSGQGLFFLFLFIFFFIFYFLFIFFLLSFFFFFLKEIYWLELWPLLFVGLE